MYLKNSEKSNWDWGTVRFYGLIMAGLGLLIGYLIGIN